MSKKKNSKQWRPVITFWLKGELEDMKVAEERKKSIEKGAKRRGVSEGDVLRVLIDTLK